MKFTVNTSDLTNLVSKMRGIAESKGSISPNLKLTKKGNELIVEYVGEETYCIGNMIAQFEKTEDGDYIIIDSFYVLSLSPDFDTYTFTTSSKGNLVSVTADNGKLDLKLEMYDKDSPFVALDTKSKNQVILTKVGCKAVKNIMKHVGKFIYKGADQSRNAEFTSVRFRIGQEDGKWVLVLIVTDSSNVLCQKLGLGDDFKGKDEIKLFIPAYFFTSWNSMDMSKQLELDINNDKDKGFIILKDGSITAVHNTLNGDNFVNVEEHLDEWFNQDSESLDLKAKIDCNSLKANLNYVTTFETSKSVVTLDFNKKDPKVVVHGEFNNNHVRELTISKKDNAPIVKLIKEGSVDVDLESFTKVLDTMCDLVDSGVIYMQSYDSNIFFYDSEKTVLAVSAGLSGGED